MTALTYTSGHAEFARYLDLVRLPGAGELTIFCGAMTGACLGFLWYNAHPAEIFMGDVGSLSLGGSLARGGRADQAGDPAGVHRRRVRAGGAVGDPAGGQLQAARRKRIFKMAPLHHHFEALGWPESKIIVRFWIAGLVMALFALTTLKLR